MKILYIGDIMAKAGRQVVVEILPNILSELKPDFVIAQAENIDDNGKAPRPSDLLEMQKAGVNFFTGGNHSFSSPETNQLYLDDNSPLVRPANVINQLGSGYKIVESGSKRILVASFLGQTVGAQKLETTNPLKSADEILTKESGNYDISVFNFHGDFSSEKRVFGYYLDGRVTAVVGDHWHVPTADAMLLPKGTAHISDVGMCGALHSSLGVKTSAIIDRWLNNQSSRNQMEEARPYQFNAVFIEVDENTNKPNNIQHIQRIID